jgi:hypothetical protein
VIEHAYGQANKVDVFVAQKAGEAEEIAATVAKLETHHCRSCQRKSMSAARRRRWSSATGSHLDARICPTDQQNELMVQRRKSVEPDAACNAL